MDIKTAVFLDVKQCSLVITNFSEEPAQSPEK
jgi:hypothetical protein